jgi:Ser/Thr protein kinase RdoA (MazF antagonist)
MATRRGDDWSKRYLKLWGIFYEQACQAIEEYDTVQSESWKCLCYHDWAFHNLVIHNGVAFLIDFDDMLLDQAVHDKANLISRYLRLYRWDHRYLLKILWNFDRFYPWRSKELNLLRVYLTFPYDFWILGRQYFLERLPWSAYYAREQWERKIALYQARKKCLEILRTLE